MKLFNTANSPILRCAGVTMIELLVSIAVMAIALAMTAPSMREVAVRADVKAAAENISQAMRLAKNTARAASQPVNVIFSTGSSGNSITFTDAGGNAFVRSKISEVNLPAINLPGKISVTAAQVSFTFDSMGRIRNFNNVKSIVLKSTVLSSHAMTVSVVNEMGYVTTTKGLVNVTGS